MLRTGLTDQVDPGCSGFDDNSEENTMAATTNFDFKFASDETNVFLKSLTWKGTCLHSGTPFLPGTFKIVVPHGRHFCPNSRRSPRLEQVPL